MRVVTPRRYGPRPRARRRPDPNPAGGRYAHDHLNTHTGTIVTNFHDERDILYWDLLAERKQQMPRSYPPEVCRQVIELARAGTKVKQFAQGFGMSDATIYNWLKQDRIDRGEAEGATTSQQLELAAAKRRIKLLETELAVARKVNEVFLAEGIAPKGSTR